jgi:hypothetical protein
VDVVAVKGKTIGVSVYEILSRKSDTTNAELHDKIVETYERSLTDIATLMQIQAHLNVKNVNCVDSAIFCAHTFISCLVILIRYGSGFDCYKNRKFEEAATHLQELLVRPCALKQLLCATPGLVALTRLCFMLCHVLHRHG